MLCLKVCHYSYFQWCGYFRGPWVSFDTTDEFSVRITKINSRIGVSWTHSLPFCFWTIFNSMNYCHINRQLLTTGSLGTFNKFVSSRFPSFDAPPLPYCLPLFIFVLVRFLVELNMSFKTPQWNLYEVDAIGAWRKCSLYGDVCFIGSPSKNQKSSKVYMKSTICHDIPSQIYWKDQKTKTLNKMQSFFHSKVFKQGSLH